MSFWALVLLILNVSSAQGLRPPGSLGGGTGQQAGGGPKSLRDDLQGLPPIDVEAVAPFNYGTVVSIQIEGNRRIEEAVVRAAIDAKPGQKLYPSQVRLDIKAIFSTGFFQDVQVDVSAADAEGGVVVTYLVSENPAVREVLVDGNKKIDDDDIDEVLNISPYSVVNDGDIAANAQRIRDLYLEKGYFLVDVEPELREVSEDLVELTFRVVENRKVVVQTVDITGNEGLPDRKIKRFLQTREGGVVPFLTQTGTFSWDALDNDRMILRTVYLEEGYAEVEVGDPKVHLSPDKRYIYVSIHVDEGPRYQYGHIAVDGDFVEDEGLTRDAVMRLVRGETVKQVQSGEDVKLAKVRQYLDTTAQPALPLETGDYFKYTDIMGAVDRITALYGDQGYAFVQVLPEPIPNPETGVVDLTFRIYKGEKIRIGQIDITGNNPTWDKVIRREIPMNEGDIYSGSSINEARMRLQRLGFFEDVRIAPQIDPSADDVLDLSVAVVEQPTGSFSVGLGFSNLENFVLTGSVSKNNFLGLGYVMSAAVNWSSLRRQGNLSFFDPYFLDSRWTLRVDAYSITQEFVESQYQRGGGIQIGRYLDPRDDVRMTLSYTLEDVGLSTVTPYQEHIFGGQLYRSGLTSTVGLNLSVDKRNNRIAPTKGVYINASTELSGGFRLPDSDEVVNLFGGQFNLWENRFNLRFYQPIIPGKDILIFRFNTSLGSIRSTDGSVVPFIHRYRAGGINSVRGYNWFSLGPSLRAPTSDDPTRSDERLILGGTQIWVNNIEIESPIIKAAGISAVVFFDAGNAFGDPYGVGSMNVQGLRMSYGFGVRWFSPIGPLRFELGFPINRYEDERASVFDFSIGSFF
jgi:outer membrane protein insertion porin family